MTDLGNKGDAIVVHPVDDPNRIISWSAMPSQSKVALSVLGTVQWQHADMLLVDTAGQSRSHLRRVFKTLIEDVHLRHLFNAMSN
jgi:hypothetical protein